MEIDSRISERAEAVSRALLAANRKVAVVESCTGGWVSEALASIAGSSVWFDCALVTYSNSSKNELAGVPLSLIESVGAVSEEVALAMAEGGLQASGADIVASLTGIAGPGGGSREKPVGSVCFAWAGREGLRETRLEHFAGDRRAVRGQAVCLSLDGILSALGR